MFSEHVSHSCLLTFALHRVVEQFLMFLYVGKVILEPETALSLLQISAKFDVKALNSGCIDFLIKKWEFFVNFNKGVVA